MVAGIASWTLAGMSRTPWLIVGGSLLALAWPAQRSLAPFTLVAEGGSTPDALIEIAYLGILLGTAAALCLWRKGGELSQRPSTIRRVLAEGTSILVAASLLELAIWTTAWLTEAEEAKASLETGLLGLQLRKLHLVAWGSLLLRLRAGTAVRLVLLVSVAWVLPILFLVQPGLETLRSYALGLFPPFSAETVRVTKGAVTQAFAPVGALWLASLLLARPGHPRS